MEPTKQCCRCKSEKPLSEFSANKRNPDGKQYRCKSCASAANKKSHALRREWNSGRARKNRLKRLFRLSEAEYGLMLVKCVFSCQICGEREPVPNRNLAVDHNHETGEIRGLLCSCCNRAIGLLRDDPAIIRRAASYVEGDYDGQA